MPIISLLTEKDAKLFDVPLSISDDDRKKVFLNNSDIIFNKNISRVGYIIQDGYFKIHKKFFLPKDFKRDDIIYVSKLCGLETAVNIAEYSKTRYNEHRKKILLHNGYTPFKDKTQDFLNEALELVKTSLRPKELFYSLITFLDQKKIERPKYYRFAEIISSALNKFEKTLVAGLDNELTEAQKEILDELMSLRVSDEELSAKKPYLITKLKKPIQATTPKKIKESLVDFYLINDIHQNFTKIFKSNNISKELLNYYAIWVIKAEHIQFDAIPNIHKKRLYMLAFIAYQFQIRQDFFIETFKQAIDKYYNDANRSIANNFINKSLKPEKQNHLNKIKAIILSSKEQLDRVKNVTYDSNYNDSQKMDIIKKILGNERKSIHDEILSEISKFEIIGTKELKDEIFYNELDKNFRKIHNRVAGILQILSFNNDTSGFSIISAVKFYQLKNGKVNVKAPRNFISKNDQKWLYTPNGEFRPNVYKIILFREVCNHIKAGTLNLNFSEKYKAIGDYLISGERWAKEKSELLERANLKKIADISENIAMLKVSLKENYETTNEKSPDNHFLMFSKDGKPRIITPKKQNVQEETIINIIGNDNYIPLIKILYDTKNASNFTSSFLHYSRKLNSKSIVSDKIILASIIALGCNIGIRKMGNISRDIGADKLDYAVRWFFSKENLDDANSKINSIINKLSLPNIYLDQSKSLHTSSDGQKFNVTVPSLHATHSFKYFGTGKGVSAYSFIDEKNRLFYNTVISASEREATYVIDGLLHDREIESTTHSTDTHGYSEVIFGICNCLGVFFAPRIKNYNDQILYTFRDTPRNYYENLSYRILPSKNMYIDEHLLHEQWDNVLRLLCSIKLKETKASNIFKRLNSYSKQNPLYRAVKELGRVHKTIFLLRYYNDLDLRQNIEKQLNKVELSHFFAKAIFFGNNQEFKLETKESQELSVACRHLIQNSIILWNYLYLSSKLSEIENETNFKNLLTSIKNSSIMSWKHINLYGEYDFKINTDSASFDMDKIFSFKI